MIHHLTKDNAKAIIANKGLFIRIYEKFDTPYFTVTMTEDGVEKITNMNGADIDFVDYTLNSVYKDIIEFCGQLCNALKGEVLHNGKKIILGFNYFPSEKPRTIEYPEHTGEFILQRVQNEDSGVLRECEIMPFIEFDKKLPEGLRYSTHISIRITNSVVEKTERYINGESSPLMYMHELLKEVPIEQRPKPSQLTKAEAYIFHIGDEVRKVEINKKESLTNMVQKKMSRDILIKDFANWFTSNDIKIENGYTYIGIVSDLFLKYINDTDIFNKYSITKEDLTPPVIGYIGEMSYDFIDNNAVAAIIKNDENRQALFKVLLAALRKPIQKKKGDILTAKTISDFNSIVETIKAMA